MSIVWTNKAFHILSKKEHNGKLIINGEYSALIDHLGERMDFFGGSKTIVVDSKETKELKKLYRHVNNRTGNGLSNPLPKDTNPIQPINIE